MDNATAGSWSHHPRSIVILGLSITSSWGNAHATTYRSLVRELAVRGHEVHFLERDLPWHAHHRDLVQPQEARTSLYASLGELQARFSRIVREADLVIVGSSIPDGVAVGRWVLDTAHGITAFYDLDTLATLAQLAAGTCEYLASNLVPHYMLYLSVTGGPTLQRIERELGAPHARALYCSVDPELDCSEPRDPRWDLGYLETYSEHRQAAVNALLIEPARREPRRRFVVAGAQYPHAIEWPANVDRLEHLPPDGHLAFYSQVAFALDVVRRDVAAVGWTPSARLFDAAACGVPVITGPWEGLDALFEPGEILIARDADDVVCHLRDLNETARREIGARARARVLASHTPAHRVAELERYLRELGA